jgi:alpha-glucosidase (family GH31 glycosyl hydrolase)
VLDYADRQVWEALRDVCFRPNEQRGVNFWWLDNWQGYQEGYNSNLWINHLVTRQLEEESGERPLILGRYAGLGSHRYPAYFSGDTCSHWEVLASLLDVNLKAGHVGMAYFSHDLGGFKGPCPGERLPLVDPELYVRWMQLGALSPIMRVHSDHGTREPWKYGEQVLEIVRAAYQLHVRLVPYFYYLARDAHDTGRPLQRPLYFLFPEDAAAYEADDEFFLGDRLLAAPVVAPGGRRRVYIPPGDYWALPDGESLRGPTTIDRVFSLSQIPLYVRAGSIIPQQQVSRRVGTALPDPLILAVYPGGNDELNLYEDDGHSLAYSSDAFTRWPFTLGDDGRTLEVTLLPMQGGFDGMLHTRTVQIVVHFSAQPKRVRVEGLSAEPQWTYDAEARRAEITLPNISTRGMYRLSIDR